MAVCYHAILMRNVLLQSCGQCTENVPERAALDDITNRLIHRDYLGLGREVHIYISDGRMEVYSPVICLTVFL